MVVVHCAPYVDINKHDIVHITVHVSQRMGCGTLCIHSFSFNLQRDLADSILQKSIVSGEDIDAVVNILNVLSLLSGSVSGLNATVTIMGNLVNALVINASLVMNADRGQVIAVQHNNIPYN